MAPIRRSSRPSPPWETLSLTQLMQQRCRERVLVDPLEWTDVHLELLQCRFEEAQSAPLRKEHEDEVDEMLLPFEYRGPVEELSTYKFSVERENLMSSIIDSEGSPLTCNRFAIAFYYNCLRVRYLPGCQSFISSRYEAKVIEGVRDTWSAPVALVMIDRETIAQCRRKQTEHYAGRGWTSMKGLHLRHLKRVTPSDPLRDPYLVAILLAIACHQRHHTCPTIQTKDSYWAQVLMTDRGDECVHLFAAHISSDYLNKFDYPAAKPPKSAQHPLSHYEDAVRQMFCDKASRSSKPQPVHPSVAQAPPHLVHAKQRALLICGNEPDMEPCGAAGQYSPLFACLNRCVAIPST
ncbi:hypothetical protein TgHK011_004165 [Trichoderma gracile]|nr:hypothetical protein TgHK011_004165 [Trichoderma gracile]